MKINNYKKLYKFGRQKQKIDIKYKLIKRKGNNFMIKIQKKNLYMQTGAISVFTMIAMLFFLTTIVGIYMIGSKRSQTQTQSIELLKEQYYNKDDEFKIYNEKIASADEKIPIYTKEQLWSIGSNSNVEIEGKIYKFGNDLSKYELKNDIVINLPDDKVDVSKIKDYNFSNSNYKIYYYYNGEYYEYSINGNKTIGTMQNKFILSNRGKTTLASQIKAENYGETINYSSNGITDWKIFYNDGTNVYLIASEYLPVEKVPTATGMTTTGTYQAYWSNVPSLQTVNNIILTKFKHTGYSLNSNDNSKCASTLLNHNNWTSFVNDNKADYAIGSPTLEMWIASWNEKYPSDQLYCNNTNTIGYYVGTTNFPTSYSVSAKIMSQKEGYSDTLYYPHKSSYNSSTGGWFASPAAYGNNQLMAMDCYGNLGCGTYSYKNFSVRPVVRLKSEIQATKNASGVWEI